MYIHTHTQTYLNSSHLLALCATMMSLNLLPALPPDLSIFTIFNLSVHKKQYKINKKLTCAVNFFLELLNRKESSKLFASLETLYQKLG